MQKRDSDFNVTDDVTILKYQIESSSTRIIEARSVEKINTFCGCACNCVPPHDYSDRKSFFYGMSIK